MKDKWTVKLIVTIIVSANLCIFAANPINLKYRGDENFVGLTLKSSELNQGQLNIMPEESINKSGIFFKLKKGLQRLKGKPVYIDQSENRLFARWLMDNDQPIVLCILKDGNDYLLKLYSESGPKIFRWGFTIDAQKDEYFTGVFEMTVEGDQRDSWKKGIKRGLNLRGEHIQMLIRPTLSMYAPFYISSEGYGLFVHGTWPGVFDFGKKLENKTIIDFEGDSLSCKIYTSKNPSVPVKKHAIEVGPPFVPPKWAFSHWRWRDDHTNREKYYDGTKVNAPYNSEVVEDVLMMKAFDIPCGIYWVDRPWAVGEYGYDDFQWDTDRFPKPQEMINWLNEEGLEFVLWIAPWVNGEMAEEAVEKGYDVKGQTEDKENRVLVDFSNPEAKKWWQENGPAKVLKMGVKGFKLDRSEEVVPQNRETYIYDGRTSREMRNDYPVQYVRSTYEIAEKVHGDDFVLMPRAAYTNSSKYAVFWGGDIGSPPEGLRTAIIALQRCAVMGYPLWGSDTGGYWQGDLDREVLARWLGFSCFCPIMEVGPTENRGLWDMDKEPNYDKELIAIWRLYTKLHTHLMDYTYKFAKHARETGMPVARPLFLAYPDQKQAWEEWQTYLYGDDILVSAIWRKQKESHELYLPAGQKWKSAWTGEIYDGGQNVEVDTPMYKIPVFVKKNSALILPDLEKLYKESLQLASQKPDLSKLEEKYFDK